MAPGSLCRLAYCACVVVVFVACEQDESKPQRSFSDFTNHQHKDSNSNQAPQPGHVRSGRASRVDSALAKTDTNLAVRLLHKGLREQPGNDALRLRLAYLYAMCKDPKCLLTVNRLSKRKPAEAHFVRGIYFREKGNWRTALDAFTQSIRADWTFIDAYLEKGVILFSQHQYEQAGQVFSLALKTAHRNPEIYYWLGRVAQEKRDTSQAILRYQQCLLFDPEFPHARARIDSLFRTTGRAS